VSDEVYCAECWALIPRSSVAWQRLDGSVVCSSCFYKRQLGAIEEPREYDRGR
jgi:hypothetical protein